jgi:hypothetical protein
MHHLEVKMLQTNKTNAQPILTIEIIWNTHQREVQKWQTKAMQMQKKEGKKEQLLESIYSLQFHSAAFPGIIWHVTHPEDSILPLLHPQTKK